MKLFTATFLQSLLSSSIFTSNKLVTSSSQRGEIPPMKISSPGRSIQIEFFTEKQPHSIKLGDGCKTTTTTKPDFLLVQWTVFSQYRGDCPRASEDSIMNKLINPVTIPGRARKNLWMQRRQELMEPLWNLPIPFKRFMSEEMLSHVSLDTCKHQNTPNTEQKLNHQQRGLSSTKFFHTTMLGMKSKRETEVKPPSVDVLVFL